MESTSTAPPVSSVWFARGVIARLAVWPTLRIAVQEGWGGAGASQKRTWLASCIVDAFEEQSVSPDDQYIEEMLLQVMTDEFDAMVEDGSAESVAKDVVKMWDETRVGNSDLVLKFEALADKAKGQKPNVQERILSDDEGESSDEEGEDGEDEDMDEDPPQLIQHPIVSRPSEPEVDADGFTLVKGKGRR